MVCPFCFQLLHGVSFFQKKTHHVEIHKILYMGLYARHEACNGHVHVIMHGDK